MSSVPATSDPNVAAASVFLPPEAKPNIDHLITEDGAPVDGVYSEKQMRLLTQALYTSWKTERPFVAMANVGLFYAVRKPAIVPDVMVSIDVELPADIHRKEGQSYFIWEYGKPPEAAIEVVSNRVGGELDDKPPIYALAGVLYYVVWDPRQLISNEALQCFVLRDRGYVRCGTWFDVLGLGVTVWTGRYEDMDNQWLRWCDESGSVLLTGAEACDREKVRVDFEQQRADSERQRADSERQRAEAERQRAEAEKTRADQLAAKLRELGIEPPA
ncbi:MAG: Uma2 family endonuclease [Gemmataceae bacterium]|nr:Uma2 family endonuclease [Gemmataceae bacterium]